MLSTDGMSKHRLTPYNPTIVHDNCLTTMTMIPYLHSAGMRPDLHTRINIEWMAWATGVAAHFRSSGLMLSSQGARPFFSFHVAEVTSANVGSSTEVDSSLAVEFASLSSVDDGVPGWWLSASLKCFHQHAKRVHAVQMTNEKHTRVHSQQVNKSQVRDIHRHTDLCNRSNGYIL